LKKSADELAVIQLITINYAIEMTLRPHLFTTYKDCRLAPPVANTYHPS
jgi:hypothetical protein